MMAAVSTTPLARTHRSRRRFSKSHPVLGFLGRRLVGGAVTLLLCSIVIFFATNALPGDVASAVLGRNATPQRLAVLHERLDLDHPLPIRYIQWLSGAIHGDLGRSAVAVAENSAQQSVAAMIATPLVNSLILAGITLILLFPLGLIFGGIAGLAAGRAPDYLISYSGLVLGALPEFVLGIGLIFLLFNELNLLPPVALVPPGASPFDNPTALVLPVLTLLGVTIAFSARQVRAGVIDVGLQEYVKMARLNGLPERLVLARYVLRNALAPAVQSFAQSATYLFGGIIIVENLYAYPGIGAFLVNAVSTRDVPVVEAIAVILAAAFILVNILADLVVVFLVPRLRTGL
jgi:peptide/nickel transport system permease protein